MPSKSFGVVYPGGFTSLLSAFFITLPWASTFTVLVNPVPNIPLSSGSVRPASCTSGHPSPSLSKSRLLGCPSPSILLFPASSSVSKIPSLSSSKSTLSSIPSSSKSVKTVNVASPDGWFGRHTFAGTEASTLYLFPFIAFVTLLTVNVWEVTPVYGVTAFGGLDWTKFVQLPFPTFSCHW